MKKWLLNWMNSCKYTAHFIRLIVGGYVVYLGAQVIYSFFTADEVSVGLLICAILLSLAGLFIVGLCGVAIVKGYSSDYKGVPPWMPPAETEENESKSSDALAAPAPEKKKE